MPIILDSAPLNFWRRERHITSEPSSSEDEHLMQYNETNSPQPPELLIDDENDRIQQPTRVKKGLYILTWVLLCIKAVELEFGCAYFMASLLLLIWLNTRTGPKAPGEVSAYSVFNPNCEAIDGVMDAVHFENELRYGAIHGL